MMICTVYIMFGLAFTSTIIEIVRCQIVKWFSFNFSSKLLLFRRQMVENLKKMQELKAQIQAQMKLAETLKKLSDNAGTKCSIHLICLWLAQWPVEHFLWEYWVDLNWKIDLEGVELRSGQLCLDIYWSLRSNLLKLIQRQDILNL